jgi:flagellar basal-body rod modification protein FlgD
MATSAISGLTYSSAADTSTSSTSSNSNTTVSEEAFLQLLVAQLKNQDPTSPVKNEDFLAQLATFSSLEQLVAIRDGIDTMVGVVDPSAEKTTDSSN